eukprot:3210151-Pyramimonas_sp.AAC.1
MTPLAGPHDPLLTQPPLLAWGVWEVKSLFAVTRRLLPCAAYLPSPSQSVNRLKVLLPCAAYLPSPSQ